MNSDFKLFGIEKIGLLLDIESSKYSDLGTVLVINSRTGLANFYGLTKLNMFMG